MKEVLRDLNTEAETLLKEQPTGMLAANLYDLSFERPLLMVFLRHNGCTFCRKVLDTLRKKKDQLERSEFQLVLMHMSDSEIGRLFIESYGLDAIIVSDPEKKLYEAFGLKRGSFSQVLGPKVLFQGVLDLFAGHGIGKVQGDGLQMPGAFVVKEGKLRVEYYNDLASQVPPFNDMLECCQ